MTPCCPHCAAPLIALRSLNLRICADCKREFDWPLNAGQAPLLNNNRADRKAHE